MWPVLNYALECRFIAHVTAAAPVVHVDLIEAFKQGHSVVGCLCWAVGSGIVRGLIVVCAANPLVLILSQDWWSRAGAEV